jgi:biopolymer transport protein TolR
MAFGRLERSPGARPMADIVMTPLIDVMLVLLVVFIVTAPLLASRLQLDLPKAEAAATAPAAPAAQLRLALDAQGRLFLDEQPITPAALREAARAAAASDAETEVLLRADREVAYGEVAELIALLQGAGLSRIGFVTDPPAARKGPDGSTPAR